MSGIDEQGGYQARKITNELDLQKRYEKQVTERILRRMSVGFWMYGESSLRGLMNVLPEGDELVEYYRHIKINNTMREMK